MVFEGYTVIYKVEKENNVIKVLEIFNKNLPQKKEIDENNKY
jgi:mRNA-degrading endonuclease RelE of RelBE toxin-antitoxin system